MPDDGDRLPMVTRPEPTPVHSIQRDARAGCRYCDAPLETRVAESYISSIAPLRP